MMSVCDLMYFIRSVLLVLVAVNMAGLVNVCIIVVLVFALEIISFIFCGSCKSPSFVCVFGPFFPPFLPYFRDYLPFFCLALLGR